MRRAPPRRLSETVRLKIKKADALRDYRIMYQSRQASLLGRREVFTGKAKFGIFGDGKETAQLAMARVFRDGDFRSGYYRDQTFMLGAGMLTLQQFFAQLYAHPDVDADPSSAGRSMTAHFASRSLNPDGSWKELASMRNAAADLSPTGSQMPRLVGLAYASKLYRELEGLKEMQRFSRGGNEVAFGTIGNASCAEGMFWESINAIGVLGVPAVISIWDDHYGISVTNEDQITKSDISTVLEGFRRDGNGQGFELHRVRGWEYAKLLEIYRKASDLARTCHVPAIIHVVEMTQPLGHSTSGSHERYKDQDRLSWEEEHDCVAKTREWLIAEKFASAAELDAFESEERDVVARAKAAAWEAFIGEIRHERDALVELLERLAGGSGAAATIRAVVDDMRKKAVPMRRDLMRGAADALVAARGDAEKLRDGLREWIARADADGRERYSSDLYGGETGGALAVEPVAAEFADDAEELRGFELLNRGFDLALARYPELIAFGEDVGQLGDVNQGLAGMQDKYGPLRVADTGIREATIIGQAIGMAMRGLRPIAEIQYLDYILYALQIISDDLASLRYRTRGGQKAPVIIRTRGHRLEGIWHAGSPMAGILGLVRGVYVCVPRDMARAVGMYNTLLAGDDPAIVVEVLNGYRLRERLPSNLGEFRVALGLPELLREGADVTVVTYGACCRIALEAAELLAKLEIDVEVIDVQTLEPYDREGRVVRSLRKTGRVVFLDEDVPGGATAYMMRQTLDRDDGWFHLDSQPRALSAQPHRPAYGSDGDYWSKPNREEIVRVVYALMREAQPDNYPPLF